MGRNSRARQDLRQLRRLARGQQPMRLVPSRRGLAVVFTAAAALGAGVGFVLEHLVTR